MGKVRLADQMAAVEAAYGWTREELLSRIRSGQIKLEEDCEGGYDLVLTPGCERDPNAPAPSYVHWWDQIPAWLLAITFPLWIVPALIYIVLDELNPFGESRHERMVRLGLETNDDDAWSYAERERMQWTLGTGRYADDNR